jgi:hypothetical protein
LAGKRAVAVLGVVALAGAAVVRLPVGPAETFFREVAVRDLIQVVP